MVVSVLGISSYEKDKVVSYTLHCAHLFPDFQVDSGATGLMAESFWTRTDLSAVEPGMCLDLIFEPGFKGLATLVGFTIIKNTPFTSKEQDFIDNIQGHFKDAVKKEPEGKK